MVDEVNGDEVKETIQIFVICFLFTRGSCHGRTVFTAFSFRGWLSNSWVLLTWSTEDINLGKIFFKIVDIVGARQCNFRHFLRGWFFNRRTLLTKSTGDITSGKIFFRDCWYSSRAAMPRSLVCQHFRNWIDRKLEEGWERQGNYLNEGFFFTYYYLL